MCHFELQDLVRLDATNQCRPECGSIQIPLRCETVLRSSITLRMSGSDGITEKTIEQPRSFHGFTSTEPPNRESEAAPSARKVSSREFSLEPNRE